MQRLFFGVRPADIYCQYPGINCAVKSCLLGLCLGETPRYPKIAAGHASNSLSCFDFTESMNIFCKRVLSFGSVNEVETTISQRRPWKENFETSIASEKFFRIMMKSQ